MKAIIIYSNKLNHFQQVSVHIKDYFLKFCTVQIS